METSKKIKYLVADTTAFINAVPLNDYAVNVLTVPEVVAEVRNKRQIRRLCVLPFDLQVREPRTESVKHCVEFAKKTGDYASLSGIDLKIVALTYELEVDNMGSEHLRKEPVTSQVIASKESPEELQYKIKLTGWYVPKETNDETDDNEKDEEINNIITISCLKSVCMDVIADTEEITKEELDKLVEKLKCNSINNDNIEDFNLLVSKSIDKLEIEKNAEKVFNESGNEDGRWITPANIKHTKKSLEGEIEAELIPQVACMTTDYALQNVLKQINLNVSALNGRVIKHLRTYILRCYACFRTTSIMTKVFCQNCGNKTLKRVAVTLDENGMQVVHINTKRPLSAKYKNQSLPRFQGGKHSRNPILFEDQPIPRQMPSRVAKTKTNALEEDYIANISPFVMRDVDSKSAMLRSKGHLKEWARNNTFEEDRRRKNYNRLYK